MFSGEHAVVFPLMAILWDTLVSRRQASDGTHEHLPRRAWLTWVVYLCALAAYLAIRFLALNGVPLPAKPYFNDPFASGFLPYTLLKLLVMVFSLTTTIPFVDRPIIEVWLNHSGVFAACALAPVLIIVLLLTAARDRRLCLVLLILSLVAYLPFIPMAAIPFYLYTPCMFYAIAVGAALDGRSLGTPRGRALHRRFLTVLVSAAAAGTFLIGTALSWGLARSPFAPGVDSPHRLAQAVTRLLENEPRDRKVIFVDAPSPPPFFYFVHLLSSGTGRDPHDFTVLTCPPRRSTRRAGSLTVRDGRNFLLESPERPYFSTPVKRLLWFFPEGLTAPGRIFERDWFTVTIESLGEPPAHSDRGHRFFSTEPGITGLSVQVSSDVPPPLVIGFRGQEPLVLSGGTGPVSKTVAEP
jgi:hypothetical protein